MSAARSHITSHVLDAVRGKPAPGVAVSLHAQADGEWMLLATASTDSDGRTTALGTESLPAGRYRVTFDTGAYFAAQDQPTLYPEVTITFDLADPSEHYHIPLLLSPFAYSTYRGS